MDVFNAVIEFAERVSDSSAVISRTASPVIASPRTNLLTAASAAAPPFFYCRTWRENGINGVHFNGDVRLRKEGEREAFYNGGSAAADALLAAVYILLTLRSRFHYGGAAPPPQRGATKESCVCGARAHFTFFLIPDRRRQFSRVRV